MRNVQELERKWIKYKIKSYALPIIIAIVLIFSVPIVIFFSSKPLHVSENNTKPIIVKKSVSTSQNSSQSVVEPVQAKSTQTDEKLVLAPSLSFVYKSSTTTSTPPQSMPIVKQQPLQAMQGKYIPPVKSNIEPPKTTFKSTYTKAKESNNINIQMHSMDNDLQDVVQRFKKTNNPTLGLFLAKKYYEMGQYKLSYNYALMTNQLDSKIDMSWIVFAKSLVKLGQKEKAITALESYSKNSHSKQAMTLLDEIESGRFK